MANKFSFKGLKFFQKSLIITDTCMHESMLYSAEEQLYLDNAMVTLDSIYKFHI